MSEDTSTGTKTDGRGLNAAVAELVTNLLDLGATLITLPAGLLPAQSRHHLIAAVGELSKALALMPVSVAASAASRINEAIETGTSLMRSAENEGGPGGTALAATANLIRGMTRLSLGVMVMPLEDMGKHSSTHLHTALRELSAALDLMPSEYSDTLANEVNKLLAAWDENEAAANAGPAVAQQVQIIDEQANAEPSAEAAVFALMVQPALAQQALIAKVQATVAVAAELPAADATASQVDDAAAPADERAGTPTEVVRDPAPTVADAKIIEEAEMAALTPPLAVSTAELPAAPPAVPAQQALSAEIEGVAAVLAAAHAPSKSHAPVVQPPAAVVAETVPAASAPEGSAPATASAAEASATASVPPPAKKPRASRAAEATKKPRASDAAPTAKKPQASRAAETTKKPRTSDAAPKKPRAADTTSMPKKPRTSRTTETSE